MPLTLIHAFRERVAQLFGAGEAPSIARASFWLLATGGFLGLVSTAFPSERPRDTLAVVVTSIFAVLLSLAPGTGFQRLRPRAYELLCAAGTVLVSAGLFFGGTSAYEFFYFWVALYAATSPASSCKRPDSQCHPNVADFSAFAKQVDRPIPRC